MKTSKKQAAAIGAVLTYLKSEEEAHDVRAMAVAAPERPAALRAVAPPRVWGLSGRQTQMQVRNMMQMKAFQR